MNYSVKSATKRNPDYSRCTFHDFDNYHDAERHARYELRTFAEHNDITSVIVQTEYGETVLFLSVEDEEVAA